jgi:hypothetical protein
VLAAIIPIGQAILQAEGCQRRRNDWMVRLRPTPFRISNYDNPETVRLRKYATGTPLVLEGIDLEVGRIPKETV